MSEQQVAVVTGGAGNIGLAIATVLLEHGHSVVIADRDEQAVARLSAQPPGDPSRLRCVTADIGTEDGAQRAVQSAVEGFGRIDLLCNNAGIRHLAPFLELEPEKLEESFRVNVWGIYYCSRAALPHMLQQGRGSVVNIASISGLAGYVRGSAYAASKAAAVMLTRVMALEFAPRGVRVNCICPGNIAREEPPPPADTRAIPVGRAGRGREVGELVVYLMSDAAAFMTGSVLTLDGGITAGRQPPG